MPGSSRGAAIALAALALVALYALHRLALWAESRGWIYYRKKRGSSGTLSSAALEIQTLVEPAKRHVLEQQRREPAQERETGDPP